MFDIYLSNSTPPRNTALTYSIPLCKHNSFDSGVVEPRWDRERRGREERRGKKNGTNRE